MSIRAVVIPIVCSFVFLTSFINSFAIYISNNTTPHQVVIVKENNSAGIITLEIANNNLSIKIKTESGKDLQLILNGALSLTKTLKNNEMNITNIKPGYYSLTIKNSEGEISYKLFQVL